VQPILSGPTVQLDFDRLGAQVLDSDAYGKALSAGLLKGDPVGYAAEYLNFRYVELSLQLTNETEDAFFGKVQDPRIIAELWTAQQDAANWVLLGDPAVRLAVDERPPG
jgi:hypothetical protein